jgi:hypothetical protein
VCDRPGGWDHGMVIFVPNFRLNLTRNFHVTLHDLDGRTIESSELIHP